MAFRPIYSIALPIHPSLRVKFGLSFLSPSLVQFSNTEKEKRKLGLGFGFNSVELNGRNHGRSERHEPGRRFPQEEPNPSLQHEETLVLLRQSRQGSLSQTTSILFDLGFGYFMLVPKLVFFLGINCNVGYDLPFL